VRVVPAFSWQKFDFSDVDWRVCLFVDISRFHLLDYDDVAWYMMWSSGKVADSGAGQ